MPLSHHRRGSGDPLLLVHGIGCQWQIWEPLLDRLALERDVVAVDLPGFGDSLTLRDRAPSVPALAEAVRAFAREELGWPSFDVAGFSLGGGVALELGRAGAARTVFAICPVGFGTAREVAFSRVSLQASRSLAQRLEPFAERLIGSPLGGALFTQLVARPGRIPTEDAVGAVRTLALNPGFEATLAELDKWRDPGTPIPCPTTIAWGTQDRLLLPRQADRARRLLPTARHEWLPGCGHVPLWDDTDAIAGLMLETARRRWRQPRAPAAV
jgi:pimeloyl-ACP methyl ester carboxylesterase